MLSVGQRLVCIRDDFTGRHLTQALPTRGRIFTVRAIVPCRAHGYDEDGLHLVDRFEPPAPLALADRMANDRSRLPHLALSHGAQHEHRRVPADAGAGTGASTRLGARSCPTPPDEKSSQALPQSWRRPRCPSRRRPGITKSQLCAARRQQHLAARDGASVSIRARRGSRPRQRGLAPRDHAPKQADHWARDLGGPINDQACRGCRWQA